jgi:flagellar basal body-associated protein FliL
VSSSIIIIIIIIIITIATTTTIIIITPWRKNPKVHRRTHNIPPPVSVLNQSNPIHTPQANLPKIHSDPIFPPAPWSYQWSLSFGLSLHEYIFDL